MVSPQPPCYVVARRIVPGIQWEESHSRYRSRASRRAGTVSNNGAAARVYLSLRQESGGITGAVTYAGVVSRLENGWIDGDQARFEIRDAAGGVTTFRLAIAGGRLSGQIAFPARVVHLDLAPLAPDEPVVILVIHPDAQGRAANIKVSHSLGFLADEKAIEAVKKMSLQSTAADGQPVQTNGTVEIIFPR